jgi:DNA-binding transcriptional regulator LsrR (DeoR family)
MDDVGHLLAPPESPRTDLDQDRLLVKVARLYYESELTQARIAQRMRRSRQKVQRLLDSAKEKGVVRIVVEPLLGVHAEREKALEERYGLKEAVIVETSSYNDQSAVARETGIGAADYLLRVIRPKDRIVLSWGGTLLAMVNGLRRHPHRELHGVLVIQGLGGVVDPSRDTHSSELARRLAHFLGGRAMPLPAPGVAGNRAARNAFLRDAHVARVLDTARGADIAFVGIGAPRQDSILVREGSIVTWNELEELKGRGAVGDINLRYFDTSGKAIASDLDDRVVMQSAARWRESSWTSWSRITSLHSGCWRAISGWQSRARGRRRRARRAAGNKEGIDERENDRGAGDDGHQGQGSGVPPRADQEVRADGDDRRRRCDRHAGDESGRDPGRGGRRRRLFLLDAGVVAGEGAIAIRRLRYSGGGEVNAHEILSGRGLGEGAVLGGQ